MLFKIQYYILFFHFYKKSYSSKFQKFIPILQKFQMNQQAAYQFQDGLKPPPNLQDNPDSLQLQLCVNESLIQFPEQVEQELALFAYKILIKAEEEYSSYGPFKSISKSTKNKKVSNPQDINDLAQKRFNALKMQIANLENVKYLADNYKPKQKEVKANEEEDEEDGNEEDEEEES